MKNQQVTVINKFTGEVYELTISDLDTAKDAYLIVNGMLGALDRAKKKITAYLDNALVDDDHYDFGDGYQAQRIVGVRRKYQKHIVAQYLNPKQMDLVTEINGAKLKELLAKLVEEGQLKPGAWKEIEAKAEITPNKPYVKITKG